MGCVNSKMKNEEPFTGLHNPMILASETAFSMNEVEALHELFKKISSSIVDDGKISKEEFKLALFNNSVQQNVFADRLFYLFDVHKNGMIFFDDFVRSLNVFHPSASVQAKADFAFRIYDLNDNGFIERDEIKQMVITTLAEVCTANVSEEAIEEILNKTINDMDSNKDGQIDIEEWRSYVIAHPILIKFMTIKHLKELTIIFPSFVLNTVVEDSDSNIIG